MMLMLKSWNFSRRSTGFPCSLRMDRARRPGESHRRSSAAPAIARTEDYAAGIVAKVLATDQRRFRRTLEAVELEYLAGCSRGADDHGGDPAELRVHDVAVLARELLKGDVRERAEPVEAANDGEIEGAGRETISIASSSSSRASEVQEGHQSDQHQGTQSCKIHSLEEHKFLVNLEEHTLA
ncbi:uncharacterized protein LOC112350798 [Selaginella moellendorffii]|uniref:uncharacterized protein LOC112350798 n=1 Tax=Selaginella moellendorffii TaxID=88036 RepID=UPI000D1CE9F7|nr:uncharacterized protein LOC112350798 [Selaginella moellendorffii]|eukprot:XP_024543400.1 uncharacterized protein LOC112350798 [Selaginella moellendorffii]